MKKLLVFAVLGVLCFVPIHAAHASTQVLAGTMQPSAAQQTNTEYMSLNLLTSFSITSPSAIGTSTMPFAGTLSSFYAMSPSNISGTQSYTFTILKNGVSSGITCTINSSSPTNAAGYQYCSDTSNTSAYVAGDGFYVTIVPANTPPQSRLSWSAISAPTNANDTWVGGESNTTNSTTAERYRTPMTNALAGTPVSVGTTTSVFFPEAGRLDKFYIKSSIDPSPGNFVDTIMESAQLTSVPQLATSSVTCTLASGGTTCTDLVNVISVAKADMFHLAHVPNSSPANAFQGWSLRWVPFTDGDFDFFMTGAGNTVAGGVTTYSLLQGQLGFNTTEASTSAIFNAMRITSVFGHFTEVPGGSDTRTITLMKNFIATALTCTETSASRDCDGTGNVIVNAGDILDWKVVTSASAALTAYNISAIGTRAQIVRLKGHVRLRRARLR